MATFALLSRLVRQKVGSDPQMRRIGVCLLTRQSPEG